MEEAIEAAHAAVHAGNASLHMVMGNESGDLDSILSAMLLALHRHALTAQQRSCECCHIVASEDGASERAHVPLLNMNRVDLAVRPEALHMLRNILRVDVNRLVFLDDVADLDPGSKECTRIRSFALVDHNKLSTNQQHISERVTALFDHHEDTTDTWPLPSLPAASARIAPVGSCVTMVLAHLFEFQAPCSLPSELMRAALGVICIDTLRLEEMAQRTTDLDRCVVLSLLCAINKHGCIESTAPYGRNSFSKTSYEFPPTFYRHELSERAGDDGEHCCRSVEDYRAQINDLFEELNTAKSDVLGLSSRDLLRKDYKQWQVGRMGDCTLGIASLPVSLDAVIKSREGFLNSIVSWASERASPLMMVMTLSKDEQGDTRRELVVVQLRSQGLPRAVEELASFLAEKKVKPKAQEHLQERLGEHDEVSHFAVYVTSHLFSRKKIAPLMLEFFKEH